MRKKIIFLTCTWQRVDVTKIFIDFLIESQNKLRDIFDITNIIIDSEKSNIELFRDNPYFKYFNHPNNPVSNKWNYGSSLCRDIDFDYIIMLGSDDILSDTLLRQYFNYMCEGYDYIGIYDMYVYNIIRTKLYYWGGYSETSYRYGESLGLGRCLSKKIVELLNYELWSNNIDRGLDGSMEFKIKNLTDIRKINFKSKDYGFACDIKSDTNITKLNTFITQLIEIPLIGYQIEDISDITLPSLPTHLTIIIPTYKNPEFLNECLVSIIESVKNLYCDILVGIDSCQDTLNYIKNNEFDERIKFYFFNENVGPYIIKNTLSKISKSDYLVFFDSDDIMKPELIESVLKNKNSYDLIKPMYLNFNNVIENIDFGVDKTKSYGEGVFSIRKSLFLNVNGFQGWRCAADSDLMGRLYKLNLNIMYTVNLGFYRRIHSNSITINPETGYMSKLREGYINLSRQNGNQTTLNNMVISEYDEILVNTIEFKQLNDTILHKIKDRLSGPNPFRPKKFIPKTKEIKPIEKEIIPKKEIDYDKINVRSQVVSLEKSVKLNHSSNIGSIMEMKSNKRKGGKNDSFRI